MKSTDFFNKNTKNKEISINNNKFNLNFIQWFVGFTDGEGCFLITVSKKQHVTFRFSIGLHVDDKAVLEYIQKTLGVGNLYITKSKPIISYQVSDYHSIKNIIIPIFEYYPLLTIKRLNFLNFKNAFLFKKNTKLSTNEYNSILKIKNSMNTALDYNSDLVKSFYNKNTINNIDNYWLLGFIEAEGTFGFKCLSPYFQVPQHSVSVGALEYIKKFLEKLSISILPNLPYKINLNMTVALNKRTNVYSYVLTDVDVLYYIIFPFFSNLEFKSRKFIDFKLWSIGLFLHKYGYVYLPEGKNLICKITNCINKKRYTNSAVQPIYITQSDIDLVLQQQAPFDLNSNKSHLLNAQAYSRSKNSSIEGFKVYVYDYNKLVTGTYFESYNKAQAFLQTKSTRLVARYIDTGKLYKNRYSFYSSNQGDYLSLKKL
jgi:hypothetical protein